MRIRSWLMTGVIIALALWMSGSRRAPAEFKLAPIPSEDSRLLGMRHLALTPYTGDEPTRLSPDDPEAIKQGELRLGGPKTLRFLSWPKSANQMMVVFDTDGDGSYANESDARTLALQQANNITIQTTDGQIPLLLTPFNFDNLLYAPAFWFVGEIDIDGAIYPAALVDAQGDGLALDAAHNDLLLLDRNRNGRFDWNSRTANGAETILLAPLASIDGRLMRLRLDPDQPALMFEAYDGPSARLALRFDAAEPLSDYAMWAMSRASGLTILANKDAFPIQIPAEPLAFEMLGLAATGESGQQSLVMGARPTPLTAPSSGPAILEVAPPSFDISINEYGPMLSIEKEDRTGGDLKIWQIWRARPGDDAAKAMGDSGLQARVIDAHGRLVAQGALEYG